MILDQVIHLIAAPQPNFQHYLYWSHFRQSDRKSWLFSSEFDRLSMRWKELYKLSMAMPDQYDYICSYLGRCTQEAWHLHTKQLEAGFATYGDEWYPTGDEGHELTESRRKHITCLLLWRLLRMTTSDREEFRKYHNVLVVYHSRPFDIVPWSLSSFNPASGRR